MSNSSIQEQLDTLLNIYHDHNCHSGQAWFRGQTEPFSCDCSVKNTKAVITTIIAANYTFNTSVDELARVAKETQLSELLSVGEIHHSVFDYRIAELQPPQKDGE